MSAELRPGEGDSDRFRQDLAESRRTEARLPWKELLAMALVVALVAARYAWFT